MEFVGEAPKVSQNKDLNQTNAEPSAKTADPANSFLFSHQNCVRFSQKSIDTFLTGIFRYSTGL